MTSLTTYLADKLIDHSNGVTAYAMPTVWIALIRATAGQSPRSAAVTSGQTTVPATPNGHMYRCSASTGNTGSAEPTWPTTPGGTVTDGGVTWTEMTPDFQANNTNITSNEANYTGYARAALAGLMGAAANESASNSAAIGFPACTGGTNAMGGWVSYDASTAGNALKWAVVNAPTTAPLAVSTGITPSFAAGVLTTQQS
ncbi:MAG TPA: hypothetical protein VL614_14850 [Acetobacteraceae bacterium]|jgi:hypothetical protein|nr:hypothetical protein [Acetobacteraceae bacterium]